MADNIGFEILPHTADFRMRVYGHTLKDLFTNSVTGMFTALDPFPAKPHVTTKRNVSLTSAKPDFLLIKFLSECLYLSDAYNEAYDKVEITHLDDTSIEATLDGYKIDGTAGPEIKAVTYHDINLHQHQNTYQATITFDI